MKKKILSMLLIATMTMIAFAGCGKKEKDSSGPKTEVTETPTTTEQPTTAPEATKSPEATKVPEITEAPKATITTEELEAAGSADDLSYTNSLIGFSFSVPESWLMKNSEEMYEYLASTMGAEGDVDTFKSTLAEQGVNYLCYGVDTQMTEGGTDNILVQSMLGSLFGGMEVDVIVTSLSAMIEQQFTNMGSTTTVGETKKITVDDQDVYQFAVTATMTGNNQGSEESQVVKQEYFIFMRNDVLVYLTISTGKEDSAALSQQFIDSLSFQ